MTQDHPYDILAKLAERSRDVWRELPASESARAHWTGIGFSLLDHRFVASMAEVAELMRVPQATRVPGVKNFVQGVANVRGRLMTIVDLAIFFGQRSRLPRAQRRVLAYEDEDVYMGFVVDESLGMQHFPSDSYTEDAGAPDRMFEPYIRGSYTTAGTVWPIFSLSAIATDGNLERLAAVAE